MQLADSAGKFAAGALIQTNTISFDTFKIVLHFSWIGLKVEDCLYNRQMKSPMLHCFKGLLALFCFSSKRYQIPFCSVQKGISYRLQNLKNPRK